MFAGGGVTGAASLPSADGVALPRSHEASRKTNVASRVAAQLAATRPDVRVAAGCQLSGTPPILPLAAGLDANPAANCQAGC